MATLRAEAWRRVALSCLACVGMGLASAAQLQPDDLIRIDGKNLRIDYAANSLQLGNVVIANRQGTMLIRAQEAKAHSVELSANDSQWEFTGDVHIEVDGAVLDAASATVSFKANRLDSALAVGSPAKFSHQLQGTTQRNQGHAGTIEFDAGKSQVRLAGGTWYSDGRNEFNTRALVYSLTDRSLDTETEDGDRVQLTIRPGSGDQPAPAIPSPPARGSK